MNPLQQGRPDLFAQAFPGQQSQMSPDMDAGKKSKRNTL
jgi:hypothetical protein